MVLQRLLSSAPPPRLLRLPRSRNPRSRANGQSYRYTLSIPGRSRPQQGRRHQGRHSSSLCSPCRSATTPSCSASLRRCRIRRRPPTGGTCSLSLSLSLSRLSTCLPCISLYLRSSHALLPTTPCAGPFTTPSGTSLATRSTRLRGRQVSTSGGCGPFFGGAARRAASQRTGARTAGTASLSSARSAPPNHSSRPHSATSTTPKLAVCIGGRATSPSRGPCTMRCRLSLVFMACLAGLHRSSCPPRSVGYPSVMFDRPFASFVALLLLL
jgi:hypothetical protein